VQKTVKYLMGILWLCYGYPMVRDARVKLNGGIRVHDFMCFWMKREIFLQENSPKICIYEIYVVSLCAILSLARQRQRVNSRTKPNRQQARRADEDKQGQADDKPSEAGQRQGNGI